MLPHLFQSTILIKTRIMTRLCTFLDENDRRFYYVYYFDNNKKEVIKVQKELECLPKVLFTGIIFGVIAAIVLMGMAILLLWKLLTTIHDRRECARFEKEPMMAKWGGRKPALQASDVHVQKSNVR